MSEATALQELASELTTLRDLFQRRLLEDRAKARLNEELFDQLAFARDGLARTYLRPLLTELLLVVDRLRALPQDEVAAGVVTELEEILGRRGVRRMPVAGAFDPAVHDAVRSEPSTDVPRDDVVAVLRAGYLLDGDVLRPASVVVSAGAPDGSAP